MIELASNINAQDANLRVEYLRNLIDRLMDRLVDEWHSGKGDGKLIHEYCNLTWEEYAKWVQGLL
jgi:hypothetical protein